MLMRKLRKELLTRDDLEAQLRQAGVDDVSRVRAAYLEGDGKLSVLKYDDDGLPNQDKVDGPPGACTSLVRSTRVLPPPVDIAAPFAFIDIRLFWLLLDGAVSAVSSDTGDELVPQVCVRGALDAPALRPRRYQEYFMSNSNRNQGSNQGQQGSNDGGKQSGNQAGSGDRSSGQQEQSSRGGSNQQGGTKGSGQGGTHEQHVNAGKQSHKNS